MLRRVALSTDQRARLHAHKLSFDQYQYDADEAVFRLAVEVLAQDRRWDCHPANRSAEVPM